MKQKIILQSGIFIDLNPFEIFQGDLLIQDDKIIDKAPKLAIPDGAVVCELNNKIVLPGLVCAHHHLYSSMARGMPASPHQPANFYEVLEWVWWVLDKNLSERMIYLSALVGGIEALNCGTTLIFDHHASPYNIPGSLEIIKKALDTIGMKACLCYETSDRDGAEIRDLGIKENLKHLKEKDGNFRYTFGGHASFTMNEDTLKKIDFSNGFHVHCCEGTCDTEMSNANYGASPIERFEKNKLLNDKTILAHVIHLSEEELETIKKNNCWMIHNARSNMNNRVGYAPLDRFVDKGCLGTDGIDGDMFAELKFAFYQAQQHHINDPYGNVFKVFQNNFKLAEYFWDVPFGKLDVDNTADLIVLNYMPTTPLTENNFLGHLIFGINANNVTSVMTNGTWKIWDRAWDMKINIKDIYKEANDLAVELWDKMKATWKQM